MDKRKNSGCLNLQCSIVLSYIISILSNVLLIIIINQSSVPIKWFGISFSIAVILLSILSFKYFLTYTSNTVVRFRSSTRFYILSFVGAGITYIVIFIMLFVNENYGFGNHIFFFGFSILAWFVFHYLLFFLFFSFIRNLEGKSGVSLIERDFKELGNN